MTSATPDPERPEPFDDDRCPLPSQLTRDLDRELRRHGIILPSIDPEYTSYGGPQVHLGVTSAECAQELLDLLRNR